MVCLWALGCGILFGVLGADEKNGVGEKKGTTEYHPSCACGRRLIAQTCTLMSVSGSRLSPLIWLLRINPRAEQLAGGTLGIRACVCQG